MDTADRPTLARAGRATERTRQQVLGIIVGNPKTRGLDDGVVWGGVVGRARAHAHSHQTYCHRKLAKASEAWHACRRRRWGAECTSGQTEARATLTYGYAPGTGHAGDDRRRGRRRPRARVARSLREQSMEQKLSGCSRRVIDMRRETRRRRRSVDATARSSVRPRVGAKGPPGGGGRG